MNRNTLYPPAIDPQKGHTLVQSIGIRRTRFLEATGQRSEVKQLALYCLGSFASQPITPDQEVILSWDKRVASLSNETATVYRQHYVTSPRIHGVVAKPLERAFPDAENGGSIRELARLEGSVHQELRQAGFDLTVKQINITVVQPGSAVGLHVHPEQREAWFVVPGLGQLTAYLVDMRSLSPTRGSVNKIVLGFRDTILGIPEGVLHGYHNPTTQPAVLVYLVSHFFDPDPESPAFQEGRLERKDLPDQLARQLPDHMKP
jgi:dTDP-4-dehydrorhamnose 3,5-epimerase-like enzyme